MRTVTATEKYRAVNEGKMAKAEFVRQMRQQFPQFVSQYNGYEDTVQILKNRQMIFEAPVVNEAFENVKVYADRPALTYSLDVLERGIVYELQAAGIEVHDKFNIKAEDLNKATTKAKANLDKDPNHYINLLSGESSKVNKHDKEEEVKRGEGKVDVFNGMKKANLKEAKELLKEGKLDDLAAKLGVDVDKLKKAADKIRDMEREKAQQDAKKLAEVEKAMTNDVVEEAPEMSLEEKKLAIGAVIGIIQKKYPNISQDIALDFIKTHYNDLINGADPIAEFEEYVSVNTDYVDEAEVEEKKGKDHDGDGDIDGDDYMAAKDKAIKGAMGKDEQLKEAIKSIIKKTLNDQALNEAATQGLAALSDQYDGLKGFKTCVIDLQNLVTEIESFNDRMNEKLQGVFNKCGDIENEDGLKVGAFLAPTIMNAFKKDMGPVMKGGYMKNIELPKTSIFKAPVAEEPKQTVFGMNETKGHNQYMKVDEGHCNEIMEKLKERYASEGIKFSKEGKNTINAGHCTEARMKKMVSEMEKEGYKVHESSCNSN